MPPTRTLIRASHIIAYDGARHRYLKDGVVVYEGDTIIHVGKKFDGTIDRLIDATNKVVTPGFIDTRIHMAGLPLYKSFIEDHGKRNFYNGGLFEMLPARSATISRRCWTPWLGRQRNKALQMTGFAPQLNATTSGGWSICCQR